MHGFQFLDELRRFPEGLLIPIIAWTAKDLSSHERRQLRDYAQAIVARTDAGDLLDKLRLFLASIH
jgi:CheY-like chemotaxis protein